MNVNKEGSTIVSDDSSEEDLDWTSNRAVKEVSRIKKELAASHGNS